MIKRIAESTAGKVGAVGVGGSLGAYGISTLVSDSDKENVKNEVQSKDEKSTKVVGLELTSHTDNLVPTKKSTKFLFNVEGFNDGSSEYSKNTSFGYAFGRFMFNPDDETVDWKKQKQAWDTYKGTGAVFSENFERVKSVEDIKTACSNVYKELKTNVQENSKLNSDAWTYCAGLWDSPKFVSEKANGRYSEKWAEEGSNDVILLWAEDYKDTWKRILENILKEDLKDPKKKENIYQSLHDIDSAQELMNFCKAAYNSAPSSEETVYGKSAREYCALDMSLELSDYPTEPV